MPLPRFRLRTLMIAVAVVALVVWGGILAQRKLTFLRLAHSHHANAKLYGEMARLAVESANVVEKAIAHVAALDREGSLQAEDAPEEARDTVRRSLGELRQHTDFLAHSAQTDREDIARFEAIRRYHEGLARKYDRAAAHPWLPVPPDPPEPK